MDYLKYDWCSTNGQQAPESYALMRDALKQAGRPIVFSLCEQGNSKPWTWAANVGHLWRTTTDIVDPWKSRRPRNGAGILTLADMQAALYSFAGPGHWNDPDMLEVGNGGMTNTEYRSHFSLWAIMAAPLIAGNDLDKMTPETSAILLNKDVIAVDQDALGTQGKRVRHENDQDIWVKPLQNGAIAVVMPNRGTAARTITLNWADLALRDLWEHQELGQMSGRFTPAPDPFARLGDDHLEAVTASALRLRQQAPRSLGTEFVLVHLDCHLGPAATGDPAPSDQFQSALAVQLGGPTDGEFHALAGRQRRLSAEEDPRAAEIQGLTRPPGRVAPATQNPVAQLSNDWKPVGCSAIGCTLQGREARF